MVKVTDKELKNLGMHIEPDAGDIDLVCGMEVSKNSSHLASYKKNTYHFCSEHCKIHFENDPEKYIGE
jgi:YHS domain-containing protein